MILNNEVQSGSAPIEGSSLLPKITNFGSISFSALKQIKRRPPVIISEEFLKRSARIKERKDKLRNHTNNSQRAPDSITNVCVQKKKNTQSEVVFWRTVEQSPNLPLVSSPINGTIKEKEPEKVLGLVTKDDRLYVLVKWRKIDAPEYVEKRKSSAEILALLSEFLNPNTSSVEKQIVKTEDAPNEEIFRFRQHVAMERIPKSPENENVSLNIKIE